MPERDGKSYRRFGGLKLNSMIRLYAGGGSNEIILEEAVFTGDHWQKLKKLIATLLRGRPRTRHAADYLEKMPFVLMNASNGFGDEFVALHWRAPMDQYIEAAEWQADPAHRSIFEDIAKAASEATGRYVRFVSVELETEDEPAPVASPSLIITSDIVERALQDAEQLVGTVGATSAIDRVHTAFHGYLRLACERSGIIAEHDATISRLFRLLREGHPVFSASGTYDEEVWRVVRGFSGAIESLNTLRNNASVAHPNQTLLAEPEAMLMINSVRTLLQYIDSKIT